MDTFFVTKKARSVRGFTMMQIFVSDKGFVKVYGMKSVTEIPAAIRLFAKEVGAPNCFVCDPHANQKSKEVREYWRPISFTLCVDNFGIKYVGQEHANHLKSVLQEHYTISCDESKLKACILSYKTI